MDYFILCPGGAESGGPELAHQLCHMLGKLGQTAYMFYVQFGQTEPLDAEAPERYRKYETEHVKKLSEIKDDSIVIVPEGMTGWVSVVPTGKKIVWWMSVDNYIKSSNEKNLEYLEKNVEYHLVQSCYAGNYLLERTNIPADRIIQVSDYIGENYGKFLLPAQYRKDMALYNPAKGYEELCPLIEATPWLNWVPLQNLDEEGMIVMMQTAKVYVDFGNHPGKDRIPREAASCGCCVITNKKGSAAFYEDVPVPDMYKFEDVHSAYDEIAVLLSDICENYEFHMKNFDKYRQYIAGEKAQFENDVQNMADIFQREFSTAGTGRKNILLVKTVSRYGSNNKYVDEWAAAMRKSGCNTCVLDGWSIAQPALYNHVLSTCKFDAVFDLNGILCSWGITKRLSAKSIYGIYVCDPPEATDLQDKLIQADDRTVVFCCDRNFCDYTERYFPMVKHTAFVPLSGSFYPMNVPYNERTMDIIFTGTYTDPEEYRIQALSKFEKGSVMAQFVEDMLEDIIVNSQYTLPECLARTLKKYNQNVSGSDFHELATEFLVVDFYARFYYRDKVLRTLLDAGLKIDVFGNGWENFQCGHKENLLIHKGGPYVASKALANAKISLNIMPWFKDGFQERIAAAMLSHTVAVTDESKYILDKFENDKELVVFSLKDIESLPRRIRDLLENPGKASEIAENGYRKVQEHTWAARVADMFQKIEEDFGVTLTAEGEGRELEFEIEYPDKKNMILDAVYELHQMAALSENDIAKMESMSKTDADFLVKKFDDFTRKFAGHLEGMEMSEYIRECMDHPGADTKEYLAELFSMQCRSLMGKLLLEDKGIQI